MRPNETVSRRTALKGLGAAGAAVASLGTGSSLGQTEEMAGAEPPSPSPALRADTRKQISQRVSQTPLIDTHEHLIEEDERLRGTAHPRVPCDDWALLFSHYLDSDLIAAGMPKADRDRFLSAKVEPTAKWELLAPYWLAVKNTGYAQAVRIAIQELYGVPDLSAATIEKVQAGYAKTRQPGFYERILRGLANIESCQVNCLTGEPFRESNQPTLLMQDLSIIGMLAGPNFGQYTPPTGIRVTELADWHRVMRWWFERYGKYAVAVKSQHAYSRDIDHVRVPPEQAAPVFKRVLQKEPVTDAERKLLEDHLFWHAVEQATAQNLPVKLHTGYYAGANGMPLSRVRQNPSSAADLCRQAPDTRFVFMHIGYPYHEEMIALAKHYTNAYIDMCWAWIISPAAAQDFLKKFIVTAPINKLLPFGGDYIPVEPVLGHALLARRGVALALSELVEEGWLRLDDALELVEPILNGNARQLFHLAQKTAALRQAPWIK